MSSKKHWWELEGALDNCVDYSNEWIEYIEHDEECHVFVRKNSEGKYSPCHLEEMEGIVEGPFYHKVPAKCRVPDWILEVYLRDPQSFRDRLPEIRWV